MMTKVFYVACLALAVTVGIGLVAQEVEPIRMWIAYAWRMPVGNNTRQLRIFNLSGVCLYVIENDWRNEVAVTAVSKRDLPTGVGCQ